MNLLIGIFETDKAAVSELGPGIGTILTDGSMHLVNSYPGSEIDGVPASDIKHIFSPLDKSSITAFIFLFSLSLLKVTIRLFRLYSFSNFDERTELSANI